MADDRTETATQLLDLAQEFVQTRGYNAFSFRDLAESVGIKTASVHYHFRTKADLGRELMSRYRAEFAAELDAIESSAPSGRARLERYCALFAASLEAGRMCVCGSLASDRESLPPAVRREVDGFFADNVTWLEKSMRAGAADGSLRRLAPAARTDSARALVAALEGALIASHASDDASPTAPWLASVRRHFLTSLRSS